MKTKITAPKAETLIPMLKLKKLTPFDIRMHRRVMVIQEARREEREVRYPHRRGRSRDPDWGRGRDRNWSRGRVRGRGRPYKQVASHHQPERKWDFLRKHYGIWNKAFAKEEKEAKRKAAKAVPKDYHFRPVKAKEAKEIPKKVTVDFPPADDDCGSDDSSSWSSLFIPVIVRRKRRPKTSPNGSGVRAEAYEIIGRSPHSSSSSPNADPTQIAKESPIKGSSPTAPAGSSEHPIASTSAQAIARERAEECLRRKKVKKREQIDPCLLDGQLNRSEKVESWLLAGLWDSDWENELLNSEETDSVLAEVLEEGYTPNFDIFEGNEIQCPSAEEEEEALDIPMADLNLQGQSPEVKMEESSASSPGPSNPADKIEGKDEDEDNDSDILIINADDEDLGSLGLE